MRKIFTFLAAISCAVMLHATPATIGAINGKFTINSSGDQVYFAQGNLQYHATTLKWFFAEHQYDAMGAGNENISDIYGGYIDLFGWGTANHPTDSSKNKADYRTFVDWGTNRILNGGDKANQWRTLTGAEWQYVMNRNSGALYGVGSVGEAYGVFLLPDNFVLPSGLTFTSGDGTTITNTYSLEDWARMEAKGAVFLPAQGGTRAGNKVEIGYGSEYWASNLYTQDQPFTLCILKDDLSNDLLVDVSNLTNFTGLNVRLVQPVRQEISACSFTTPSGNFADLFSASETWNETKSVAVGSSMTPAAGAPYYWNSNNANLYKWNEPMNEWYRVDLGGEGTVLTGGKYKYSVQIRIDGNNAYAYQFIEDVESITIKVDGVDWTNKGGYVATPKSDYGNYSYFNVESPEFELENALITNVALSNVVFPEKGAELISGTMYMQEELGFESICPPGASYYVAGIRFMNGNGGSYAETALKPGTTYQMQFYIAANPGYDFPHRDDGNVKISEITTTVNGISRYSFVWDKDYCIFSMRFTTSKDTISNMALEVVFPDYGDSVSSAVAYHYEDYKLQISVDNASAYYFDHVVFYQGGGSQGGAIIYDEEVLQPNTTYKAHIWLHAEEGYMFDYLTTNQVLINGEPALAVQKLSDYEFRCIVDFTTGQPLTEVDEINISVVLPNTGDAVNGKYHENLYYSLTDGPAQITIPDDANYFMMVYWFLDENKQNFDEEAFLPEKTYMFGICLIAPEYAGYIYANPVNALINGAAPNEVLEDAPHSKQYGVYFTTGKLEGIENTAAEVKATKVLRDGVLLIEKNGRTYNAQGAEVR